MGHVARVLERLRAPHALLAGAVVLAALLRFSALDARGWWRDEAVTVELLRLPFSELVTTIPDSEGTPPLYYVVAWGWAGVLGDSEVALRSLSALLGTLAVLVVFLAGRELVSVRVGLVAAYLAAASPLLVWHAQDARAYSLLVLLSSLSFLFFVRLLRAPSRRDAAAFTFVSCLALLTHYFAVFLVVPEAVWLLARSRTRRLAMAAVVGIGAVGLALVPLALAQRGNVSWVTEVPRSRRFIEVVQEFLVGPQAPLERLTTILAAALVIAAVVLLAWRGTETERRAVLPAAVIGTAALAVPLLLALVGLDYVLGRNLIAAWVPLSLVVVAGLATRRARFAGLALTGAVVTLAFVVVVGSATKPKYDAEDWRGAARGLGDAPAGGRAIVLWPDVGREPFVLYRPAARDLPASGAEVREVVVVTFGDRRRNFEELGRFLVPPSPPFRQVHRRDEPYFTLARFRADEPVFVTPRTLVTTEPDAPLAAVLYER